MRFDQTTEKPPFKRLTEIEFAVALAQKVSEFCYEKVVCKVIANSTRLAYYPGASDRLASFKGKATSENSVNRGKARVSVINKIVDSEGSTRAARPFNLSHLQPITVNRQSLASLRA